MHISLSAEQLFTIGPVSVTNSLLSFILISVILVLIAYLAGKKISIENPSNLQLFFESVLDMFYTSSKDILGKEYGRKYFSFAFSFFLIIVISNWFGLLPFVPSIGVVESENHYEEVVGETLVDHPTEINNREEDIYVDSKSDAVYDSDEAHQSLSFTSCALNKECVFNFKTMQFENGSIKHIFRSPSADLSFTLAIALVSVVVSNLILLKEKNWKGLIHKYFHSFNIIDIFVGLLEIVSELGKVVSFAFRLFGNVFAGEVLLTVITSITFGLATLPFLGLEVFVGFIQAFVFTMLTLVFLGIAMVPSEH